jgi:SAM-dependent methyltransferase
MSPDYEHWARNADDWIAWARTPDHDAFWAYRAQLLDFIGTGKGNALEVGCGEGRVSRAIKECGYRVTAADPVEAFVVAAREAKSADDYRIAPVTSLPFEDHSFDLVVAYNVLMDVDDVPAATKEIARVLRPSGTLMVSVVHPFVDRGRFASAEPEAPFVLERSYFGRERFEAVEESGGLRMHFAGWSHPLESYVEALESVGLAINSLREPKPNEKWPQAKQWSRVPLFLWLKARQRITI